MWYEKFSWYTSLTINKTFPNRIFDSYITVIVMHDLMLPIKTLTV